MPELPEVETIVRELQPILSGKTIANIQVLWPRTVYDEEKAFTTALTQNRIVNVQRRGKYICFLLAKGGPLTIHLRMTGKLVFQPAEKDRKHTRIIFHFTDGPTLHFIDTRKFGRLQLWSDTQPLLPLLGPEPLEEKIVHETLSNLKTRRPIKTILLDQKILAGVGNIYADEALFRAGIHPLTPANTVSKPKLKKLGYYIPEILWAAIENKGTTISDYRRTDRQAGNNQLFLKVYGRRKLPCFTCQTPIVRITINARGSHFCPNCQPIPK
jgi:formamidopyrimidine-DNA glycosylase